MRCGLVLLCWLAVGSVLISDTQVSQKSKVKNREVAVPESVGLLVRPILDEKQKGSLHDEHKLNALMYRLTQTSGQAADEALVVLMCFDTGESQEEADAVVSRGKKMLPVLQKYRNSTPAISERSYGSSMLKAQVNKAEIFDGVVKAINQGWHSTAENPD
jgi:hypothetical protein